MKAPKASVAIATDLVSHYWLLDSSEVLKGRQEHVAPLGATDVLNEVA